jgi:hypothetical protein
MTIKLAYTREEAATACGVSVDSIKRAINRGDLRAKRSAKHPETGEPTGKYLILAADLQAWLEGLAAA